MGNKGLRTTVIVGASNLVGDSEGEEENVGPPDAAAYRPSSIRCRILGIGIYEDLAPVSFQVVPVFCKSLQNCVGVVAVWLAYTQLAHYSFPFLALEK